MGYVPPPPPPELSAYVTGWTGDEIDPDFFVPIPINGGAESILSEMRKMGYSKRRIMEEGIEAQIFAYYRGVITKHPSEVIHAMSERYRELKHDGEL